MSEPFSARETPPARELTHALLDLSSAVDHVGRAAAARLGIHRTDLICLNLLLRNGPTSAGEVAGALGVTTAAVSAMAARLEAGGYARREIDPADRRRILLHASPDGARRASGLFDDLHRASAALAEQYGEDDLRRVLEVLDRFGALLDGQAAVVTRPDAARRTGPAAADTSDPARG
jgi:DNA-binding MarR family transcriptional regulator